MAPAATGETAATETEAVVAPGWPAVNIIRRATFGGSVVTHLTWTVLGGIAGVSWIGSTSWTDHNAKLWGMGIAAGLSVLGVAALALLAFVPTANLVSKDLASAIKKSKEKGKPATTRVLPIKPASVPASRPRPKPRREKATHG